MYEDFELGALCDDCAKKYYNTAFNSALSSRLLVKIYVGKCSLCGTKKRDLIQKRIRQK